VPVTPFRFCFRCYTCTFPLALRLNSKSFSAWPFEKL
jgi:hypothetical protein